MKALIINLLLIFAFTLQSNAQNITITVANADDKAEFNDIQSNQITHKVIITDPDFEEVLIVDFDGMMIPYQKESEKRNNLNETIISYSNSNDDALLLRKRGKKLRGEIYVNGSSFNLIYKNEIYYLFKEVTDYDIQGECNLTQSPGTPNLPGNSISSTTNENAGQIFSDVGSNVRMMILYTDDVYAAYSDPVGEIKDAMDRMNTAFNNSLVGHDVEIALIEQVTYNEYQADGITPKDKDVMFAELRNDSDGILDFIHELRQLYDADLVHFVTMNVEDGGDAWCGFAYHIGFSSNDTDASTGWCMTKMSCMDGNNDHTFSHEFGHLYGCRHDPYVDSNNTPYSNGHGYVNLSQGWRTIMAYATQCDDNNSSCPRINNFSNPNVTNGGFVTGTNATHFNAAVLFTTYSDIVDIEETVVGKLVWTSDIVANAEVANIKAESTISTVIGQPYQLYNGAEGTFTAPDAIILREGFKAFSGSSFGAILE